MNSILSLTTEERRVLQALTRSRTAAAADVKRARLMMMLDQGLSWSVISAQLPCTPDYISRWKGRFEAERLGGSTPGIGVAPQPMALLGSRLESWP